MNPTEPSVDPTTDPTNVGPRSVRLDDPALLLVAGIWLAYVAFLVSALLILGPM